MKANEIMIGDLVSYRGIVNRVAPADFCQKAWIEEIKPIPLTPDQARSAVEIARDEMVEKAIEWVEYNNENGGCKFDGWVENIKQAMKDE